jgi:hypothetical protein
MRARWLMFGLLFGASMQARALNWPDVAPPCNGTLQACIDAASSGAVVYVQTSATVNPGPYLYVTKPLSLLAAAGYHPVFAAGSTISAYYTPAAGTNWALDIEGFTLLDGMVIAQVNQGNATVTLRNLEITTLNQVSTFTSGIGLRNSGTGTLTFELANNRVHVAINDVSQPPGIYVDSASGFSGSIHDNRITSSGTQGMAGVVLYPGATSSARVYANQISGRLGYGILEFPYNSNGAARVDAISNAIQCSSPTGFGLSMVAAAAGSFDAYLYNNTVVGCQHGFSISNSGALAGTLSGNLIAYNTYGVYIGDAFATGFSNDHNLVFGNGSDYFTPGVGTVTSDPLLRRGTADARLSSGSPAIDAADSISVHEFLSNLGISEVDADGLRRFKGTGLADIGAFEFGDASVVQRNVSGASSASVIDNAALNGLINARPQLMPTRMADSYQALSNDHYTGLDYASSRYRVRDEDNVAFTANSAFNVFAPAPGPGSLLHSSALANVFGFGTRISDPYLDNQPNRIVLATHRAGTAFDHPFSATYAFGNWFLFQDDATSDFPSGLNFHVYAQDPSLNAFRWVAPEAGSASYTVLDQSVINGEPCAQIHATAGYSGVNAHPIELRYSSALQRWRIENIDGATLPAGQDFYVVVDESATVACRYDHIFHDSFDPRD